MPLLRASRRAWRSLSCFAALGLFWGGWAALLPAVKEATEATDSQLGFALLLVAVGALPAMLTSGRLYDRFGQRALAPAAAAFGVAVVVPGFAGSVAVLALALVAVGAASGALDVVMNAAVAADEARLEARLMHLAHAIFSGTVVVGAVGVGLARAAGAGPLPVLAVIGALIVADAVAVRRPEGEHVAPERAPALLHISPALLVLGGLCALSFLVENAIEAWSALHLERTLGAGPAVGGLGPGLFAAAATVGRLGGQAVAARVSERALLTVAGLGGGAGTLVTAVAPSPPVALAGVALAGAAIALAAPTLFGLAGRIGGAERGAAISTVATLGYLGFLVGPPLVGAVSGLAGLRVALAVVAAVAALLAALSRLAPRAG